MGHGIGNLSEEPVAEVLLTLLCWLFLTEHCECLSVSYLHVPSIPRHVPAPRHGKSEQQMCFLPSGHSCDAVGISDLGGQRVGTWGQVPPCRCKVQNGALRPPSRWPPSGCRLIIGPRMFSLHLPLASRHSPVHILALPSFAFSGHVGLCFGAKVRRKSVEWVVGGRQGRG